MRQFDDKTSWEGARAEILYTVSVLGASKRHDKILHAVKVHLDRWGPLEAQRREADDAIVMANAAVAWADHDLDAAVRAFANEVLHESGHNTSHRTYVSFFPEPPNEIIRLGLESEIARCERFDVVASRIELSKASAAKLAAVNVAIEAGKVALKKRRDAFMAQAQCSLDITSWKEAANNARVSCHLQLQAWGLDNNDERAYAERFFPARSVSKGSKGDDGGDPPAPTPADPTA